MIACATSCNVNYSGSTHIRVQIDGLKLVKFKTKHISGLPMNNIETLLRELHYKESNSAKSNRKECVDFVRLKTA